MRLPVAMRALGRSLGACFAPVAEHVSAGFQLHSCTPLDATPLEMLGGDAKSQPGAFDLVQIETTVPLKTPVEECMAVTVGGVSRTGGGASPPHTRSPPHSLLILASPQRVGTSLAKHGVQLALFRARWVLQDAVPPSWEVWLPVLACRACLAWRQSSCWRRCCTQVCALGGYDAELMHSSFYRKDYLALLHQAVLGGTTLTLRHHARWAQRTNSGGCS